jgi:cell division protein ZapA
LSTNYTVTVSILEKDYQVACPREQEQELIQSANYLDRQMRSIRETGKVIGVERIAVMAALNISHELLQSSMASDDGEALAPEGVRQLNRKIDEALYQFRQLDIT